MVMTIAQPGSRSLSEVDIELFTFVERYATNPVRWDLLLLFGRNPEEALAPAEIARLVKRTVKTTTKELDDLTYLRVLTRRYSAERVTYQLTRRGHARRTVMRLSAYAQGRSDD